MPDNYTVLYVIYVEENVFIENAIKLKFSQQLDPSNKEWLCNVELDDIINFIKDLCNLVSIPYKEQIFDNKLIKNEDIYDMCPIYSDVAIDKCNEVELENITEVVDELDSVLLDDISSIKVNSKTRISDLREICGKFNLVQDGLKGTLYTRIIDFKNSKICESKTLSELRNVCKENNLIHTGNKAVLEDRIKYFEETGENKRYFSEDNDKTEEQKFENIDVNKTEIEDILQNLICYTYDELLNLCKKYYAFIKRWEN